MNRLHKLNMTKQQNKEYADNFNKMMKKSEEVGYLNTEDIIKSGIQKGHVLEIGPGPGILGLNWLKKTSGTYLTGLEICPDMIINAKENAAKNKELFHRVTYIHGNADSMPFDDNSFDAVFSNSSLHEWEHPCDVLSEIQRVLLPGGKFYISDFRKDMKKAFKYFIIATTTKKLRKELRESMVEAYTKSEAEELLEKCGYKNFTVDLLPYGLIIKGETNNG